MATELRYPKGHVFFDGNAAAAALGSLEWFDAGTTSNQTVYADKDENTPLPNPLTLDSAGRAVDSGGALVAIYFSDAGQDYKEVLKDSDDATVYTDDEIPKPVDPTSGLSDFAKPLTEWSTDTGSSVTLATSDLGEGRLADTSSNSITYNLPSASAAGNGKGIAIKQVSGSNAVIISADGSETIDGSASNFTLSEDDGVVWIFSDGANWRVLMNQGVIHPGFVGMWTTNTAPSGWLECDGSAVSRTTYANLFAAIGEKYGNGDGSTTFNLPDGRGHFLRGYDNGAGNDPDAASRTDRGDGTTGDNVGTKQDDEFELHGHPARYAPNDDQQSNTTGGINLDTSNQANHPAFTGTPSATVGEQIGGEGGNETRPLNIAFMFVIKT